MHSLIVQTNLLIRELVYVWNVSLIKKLFQILMVVYFLGKESSGRFWSTNCNSHYGFRRLHRATDIHWKTFSTRRTDSFWPRKKRMVHKSCRFPRMDHVRFYHSCLASLHSSFYGDTYYWVSFIPEIHVFLFWKSIIPYESSRNTASKKYNIQLTTHLNSYLVNIWCRRRLSLF